MEDVGIDHSCAPKLNPVVIPPVVDLDAWFGEWKEGGTKANFDVAAQVARSKQSKHTLELRHRHILVDPESLHLMEHREVRGVRSVRSIDPPQGYNTQWQRLRFHDTNLHGARLASEQHRIAVRRVVQLFACRG